MNKRQNFLITLLLIFILTLCSCNTKETITEQIPSEQIPSTEQTIENPIIEDSVPVSITLNEIPPYSGKPYIEVNNNYPYIYFP